jgi:enterochelin esterase family protein
MTQGRVVIEKFESDCLKNNPLNDPHIRDVPVYLPHGYDDSDQAYPVIYIITGFTGWGMKMLNLDAFDENISQRLDRLINSGEMKPAIVVMPDCMTWYGGSQYVDSSATGNYETHLMQELIPFIDEKYRTKPNADQRAIMGKSSGGYGALILGMRHPEVFGVAVSHSGDLAFEYCCMPEFPVTMITLEKYGGVHEFIKAFYKKNKKSHSDFATFITVAMGACYSPNPDTKPHLFDLPFDLKTAALRKDVWQRWLAWDPLRMMDSHEDALRKLKIFVDCGTKDEFKLYAGARMFSAKLKDKGIDHIHEEFEDGHMSISYRFDRSLPWITEMFETG